MDLESTFYILAIIYMIFGIMLLIGIVVVLFYIKNKIAHLQKLIELRINDFTTTLVTPIKKAANTAKTILPKSSIHKKKRN